MRTALKSALALGAASMSIVVAQAQETDQAAWRFGALPSVQDVALSPEGRWLAVVEPAKGGQRIVVGDLEASTVTMKPILANSDPDSEIQWCEWPNEDRLICQVSYQTDIEGTPVYASRMVIMNRDGSEAEILTARLNSRSLGAMQYGGSIIAWSGGDDQDSVLMTRDFIPERQLATRLGSTDEGLGVERIDLATLKRTTVEKARKEAAYYLADETGAVRIMMERDIAASGYLEDSTRYLFRPANGGMWRKLEPVGLEGDFTPVAIDGKRNLAYGFAEKDGFAALHSVALDGSGKAELLFGRPGEEVDGLVRLGPGGRVIGASYLTDRRETEFFDPAYKVLGAAFAKALPGSPHISFVDASRDESRLLLISSRDTDPGTIYLFDKDSARLETILPLRGNLAGTDMAPMTAVSYPAADGTSIPAYLTLPPGGAKTGLPAVVMPHGGPSARDEWGFDWMVQYFASQGYAVLQPNYRGSSGYGSGWYGDNGIQGWQTTIGDVNDAGRWLIAQGIAAPDKLAIVGWSYGGYAALQSQVVAPELYRAVVAIAPVTDFEMLRNQARDYTNFNLVDQFIGRGPHIEAGSPARHADAFSAPVLMFHGERDKNVDIDQARRMDRELRKAGKSVELVEYDELDHYLADHRARYELLTRSNAFLAQHLGL